MARNADGIQGTAETDAGGGKTRKFLTFCLDNETYGLDVLKVKEIVGITDITSIPNAPPYVKGVMNLRGRIIPVIDLRRKFGFTEREYTGRTCIIVVEAVQAKGKTPVGVVVDSVSEVANISDAEVEATPDFGEDFDTDYVMGLAKVKGLVIIMLDIDRVLSSSGPAHLTETA